MILIPYQMSQPPWFVACILSDSIIQINSWATEYRSIPLLLIWDLVISLASLKQFNFVPDWGWRRRHCQLFTFGRVSLLRLRASSSWISVRNTTVCWYVMLSRLRYLPMPERWQETCQQLLCQHQHHLLQPIRMYMYWSYHNSTTTIILISIDDHVLLRF